MTSLYVVLESKPFESTPHPSHVFFDINIFISCFLEKRMLLHNFFFNLGILLYVLSLSLSLYIYIYIYILGCIYFMFSLVLVYVMIFYFQ